MTPFRTTLVFIALTVIGIACAFMLEVDFAPREKSHTFYVAFSSSLNDPPLVIEQKITSILEGALSDVEGVREIKSVSRFGGGYLSLLFDSGDIQKQRLKLLMAIRQVAGKLPEGTPFPTIELGQEKDTEEPLLTYSLTSSLPVDQIVDQARQWVIPKLGMNPGIKSIDLSTDSRPAILLTYSMDRLSRAGISPSAILYKLQTSVFDQHIGTITSDGATKSVTIQRIPQDIRELLDIKLTEKLRIGDVATIKISDLRPTYLSRLNGKNSVLINVFAHEHENRPDLAKKIRAEASRLAEELPSNLQLLLSYDDTEFITKELQKITRRALLSIGILSLLVLMAYRRFRLLVVLIGSVLVSLGLTAVLLYILHIPVHLYTIAALTISFGLVIDNSIMVIDHLRRKGNLRVITALLAATLTTIAALLIIFILPAEDRAGLDDFAIAISLALAASIIVSLLFTPALFRLLKFSKKTRSQSIAVKKRVATIQRHYFSVIYFLSRYKKLIIVAMIFLFGLPVYMLPKQVDGFELYNKIIGSDIYQENIRPISDKILGGMLRSFYLNVFESSGYRTPEKTRLYISASLDEGHTIEQMDDIMRKVEAYLAEVDGLESFRTTVYSGKYAQIVIEFTDASEEGSLPYVLKNRLIQRSLDWGGVDWSVYGVGRGFSNASGDALPSFRVKLMGYSHAVLESIARQLAEKLVQHPRIKEVNTNDRVSWQDAVAEQLTLVPTKQVDAQSYASALGYARQVSPPLSSHTYIAVGEYQFPLRMEALGSDEYSIYRLFNEAWGQPLQPNAEIVREVKTSALYRENRSYVRILSFEYYGSYRFGSEYLNKILSEFVFPPGYSFERLEFDWRSAKTKRQYSLIGLILILIFVICTATFESIRFPLYILFIIPLSFIGVFITFSYGGFYFDQGGYAAFILLAGIVVNATIFVLNESRNYPGSDENRNIIKACTRKFLPILLTIASTCLGLVPFLLDGQQEVFWFSFAVGVIGGLVFSIFLVFVVFPVLLVKHQKDIDRPLNSLIK